MRFYQKTGFKVTLACVTLLAVIILSFKLYFSFKDGKLVPFYMPEINDHPKYFINIKGHIDQGLKVKLVARYFTNNERCQINVNWLAGVYSPREKDIYVTAEPDSKGNYSLTMPLDAISSGKCDWSIGTVQYYTKILRPNGGTDHSLLLNIYDNDKIKLPKEPQMKFYCKIHNNLPDCLQPKLNFSNISYSVPITINHLTLDFYIHKGD